MKKIVVILAILLLICPVSVNAGSGCCSHHIGQDYCDTEIGKWICIDDFVSSCDCDIPTPPTNNQTQEQTNTFIPENDEHIEENIELNKTSKKKTTTKKKKKETFWDIFWEWFGNIMLVVLVIPYLLIYCWMFLCMIYGLLLWLIEGIKNILDWVVNLFHKKRDIHSKQENEIHYYTSTTIDEKTETKCYNISNNQQPNETTQNPNIEVTEVPINKENPPK